MRTRNAKFWYALAAGLLAMASAGTVSAAGAESSSTQVHYRKVEVEGVSIFYREAGKRESPTLLLLHGFPTSSHMFRDLIPALADRYHVVAPDYPGFGYSDAPPADQFEYSFDHLARLIEQFTEQLQLSSYSLYVMDYGAPVGFRLAAAHPERIDTIIVQNGNAYAEGFDNPFWDSIKAYWRDQTEENRNALRGLLTLDATKWQYTDGVRDLSKISPDTWGHVQPLLDRPGNQEIQLDLFLSYGSNPPLYPEWQAYFRKHQPPMLIVWGKNDQIFPPAGAHPYLRDLPNAELHLLDTGHFALEEEGEQIARRMRAFLKRNVNE